MCSLVCVMCVLSLSSSIYVLFSDHLCIVAPKRDLSAKDAFGKKKAKNIYHFGIENGYPREVR